MPSHEHPTPPRAADWPPDVPPFRPPMPPTQPLMPWREEPSTGGFHSDVANRLLDQGIITVSGKLDETASNRVTSQLILLGRKNLSITLHLSCSESELSASLALADAIDLVRNPVEVIVHGTLRGPAVAVLCAAEKRAAHRHALFVLSVPDTSGEGTADQLTRLAEQHERQVEQLARRIAEVSGQQVEIVEADLETGRLLSAEEARDYGLVEEVL